MTQSHIKKTKTVTVLLADVAILTPAERAALSSCQQREMWLYRQTRNGVARYVCFPHPVSVYRLLAHRSWYTLSQAMN